MKKRIFIGMHYMEIGGAEASLIGLLQSFDYSEVDVDLFVYSHQGEFMQLVPKGVRLLPENMAYKLTECGVKECLRSGYFRMAWAHIMSKIKFTWYVKSRRLRDYGSWFSFNGQELTKALPDLFELGEYDLAISFVVPHRFVLDHVKAKKTIGWIHTDYTITDPCRIVDLPIWGRLDKIVSISDDVTKSYLTAFPEYAHKIVLIENILSPEFVRERAGENTPLEYGPLLRGGKKIICSLGRICEQKNFKCIPKVAKRMAERGIDFHWFVLGPGDASAIMDEASELGVEDRISFIGPRGNPYPYVKFCDVYAQPSLYEGKSVAVREAQILQRPVVITDYPTASSQVKNGWDGIIVESDNTAIADGIADLLLDEDKRNALADYLATHDYGNEAEVEKIYALI